MTPSPVGVLRAFGRARRGEGSARASQRRWEPLWPPSQCPGMCWANLRCTLGQRRPLFELEPITWTRGFFSKECPCGSRKRSYECCWRGNGCWEKTSVGVITGNGGSFANERCYASPLKGCSTKITTEHFLSRSILEKIVTTPTMRFEKMGHFFGGKDRVEISINDFSSKVLCDSHNGALSVLTPQQAMPS